MPCVQHKDGDGHHWIVPSDKTTNQVDVWWSRNTKTFRGKKLTAELLVLRQVRKDGNTADVLTLPLGQVYDLIDALNKAVENS